jgi:ClpP class serine protease
MKFQQIIEAVYFKPWSITDAGWRDIHRIVKPHLLGQALPLSVQDFISARVMKSTKTSAGDDNGDTLKCPNCGCVFDGKKEPEIAMGSVACPNCGKPVNQDDTNAKALAFTADDDDCPDMDFFGQPIEQFQVTPDGLAIVPVFGPLINHASLMDRMCGACSYQQIQNDLLAAQATPGLKRIVLKIGSPGGMCNGMKETVNRIFQVREAGIPIKAISDTGIASAAYGLASACDSIEITETTMIGHVGSLCAILDSSKAFEIEGLLMQVFKSGEYKGAGMDGTSLSAKQKAEFQKCVDYFGEQFREIVRSTRIIDETLLQGQQFIGEEAITTGFADKIIEDISSGYAPDEEDGD